MKHKALRILLVLAGAAAVLLIALAIYGGPIPYGVTRTMDAIAFTPDGTLVGKGSLQLQGEGRWWLTATDDYLGTMTLTVDGREPWQHHAQMILGEGWQPLFLAESADTTATAAAGAMAQSNHLVNKVRLSIPQPDSTLLLVYAPSPATADTKTLLPEFQSPIEQFQTTTR